MQRVRSRACNQEVIATISEKDIVPFPTLRGQVVVVWDRGNNHKGPLMRKFLARHRRLTLEMLPPWAPELNPVEPIWSWLKYGELANFVPDDTDVLDDEILDRIVGLLD